MQGPYADHILDARDVCRNCYRRIREDRVSAYLRDDGGGKTLDSHYSPVAETTARDHVDCDPEPAHCETVFCACGVETAFDRIADAVDYEDYKALVKRLHATLDAKGVAHRRRVLVREALHRFKQLARRFVAAGYPLARLPWPAVDDCLADAVATSIQVAAAGDGTRDRSRA